MRIAVDLRSLMETGGKISGVENYLINVLRHLPKENLFGFYNSYREVSMPEEARQLEIKSSRIPNKFFNLAQAFLGIPKLEQLYGGFDALWMPDLRPFAIKRQTKLAITAHDLSPITHPELYSLKRRIWHKLIQHKKSFQRANLVFAVSEYTKYDLVKILDIDPNKIKVVYPGIDHARFNMHLEESKKQKVKNEHNLPDKFILSVSTVEPRKNIPALIKAFEQVQDQNMHLVVAGRLGWLYKDLLRQIHNSPKKNKIKFLNYVQEQDKPYLISLAHLVCFPSFYEGFGFVPLEAMACGVPVITSAKTSMPEACADAALLVEPYNLTDLVGALKSLLNDHNLRDNLIKKGLERVKNFSWEKTAAEINKYLLSMQ